MTQGTSGYGVTPAGFVPKTQQELVAEATADLLSTIANDLDVSPVVPLGQVVGSDAEKNAELWEALQVAYNATNRGAAEGPLLDNIGALTGCRRQPATYSSVWCACAFTQAGTYAAGALVGFVAGLSSQQASNSYAVVVPSTHPLNGNPVSTSNPYVTGSTYAGATLFAAPLVGPTFADALIGANAGLHGGVGRFSGQVPVTGWMGPATLSGVASVEQGSSTVTFAIPQTLSAGTALAFDASGAAYFVASNVTAATSVTLTAPYLGADNPAAIAMQLGVADLSSPTVGALIETDAAYRVRQVQDFGAQGSCNLAAIEVDVVDALMDAPSPVAAPTCVVYENTGDTTDANGLPPHSYQAIVFDGINPNVQQNNPIIALAIWNNKPAGLKPYGSTTVTVVDSQGAQRQVSFTRPVQRSVYMTINVAIAATASASQVQALVRIATTNASQGQPFAAYGVTVTPAAGQPTTLLPGVDVVPSAFGGLAQAQAGVVEVTSVLVGLSPSPTTSNVLPTPRGYISVLTTIVVNCTVFQP